MRRPQHLWIRVERRDLKNRGDDESSDEEAGVVSPDSPDSPSPAATAIPAVAPAVVAPPAAIAPPVVIAPPAAATPPLFVSPPTVTLPVVAVAAEKPDNHSPTNTSFPAIVNVGEPPDSPDTPSPTALSFPGVTKTEEPDTPSPTTTSFPVIVNAGESSSASPPQTEATTTAGAGQSTSSISPPSLVTTAAPDPLPVRPSASTAGAVTTTRARGSAQLSSNPVRTGLAPAQQTGDPGRTQSNASGLGPDPQLGGARPELAASAPDSTGTKVGIAFGVIAGVALLATVIFLLWKRKKRGQESNGNGSSGADGWWRSRDSASSSRKSSIIWGGTRFTRSTRAATEPRSQSKILDDLISAAYAAEDGNAQPRHQNSFVMPHGFVADEKSQTVQREDFLLNERVTQASIRKSLAGWLRGRHPLDLNPFKRKSTSTLASSPYSVAEPQPTMADLPPVPAIQSRWSESTRPSAGRNTRQPQESLYDLYARTPSGMTWAMDPAAAGYHTGGSESDVPTRAQSMMSEAIIPPNTTQPQLQSSVPRPPPDLTAAWVESQTRIGGAS